MINYQRRILPTSRSPDRRDQQLERAKPRSTAKSQQLQCFELVDDFSMAVLGHVCTAGQGRCTTPVLIELPNVLGLSATWPRLIGWSSLQADCR
jgi:hypothetical protein